MPIVKFWNGLIVLLSSLLWLVLPTIHSWAEVDEKALEMLEKTSAYYQELENFSATYKLTIHYPEEDKVYASKMTITARGQQYRLCYDQKETITDGETVWVYDKALKEVTISDYVTTDCDPNFAELYNLYQQGYRSCYMGEHVVHRAKNIIWDRVQLIPMHEDSSFKSITLEIDRATSQIHRWEIVQNEETRYICSVSSFAVNLPLSDDYFTFDIAAYKDLEVIDLRANETEEVEAEGEADDL